MCRSMPSLRSSPSGLRLWLRELAYLLKISGYDWGVVETRGLLDYGLSEDCFPSAR